jgi:hypothetical protein
VKKRRDRESCPKSSAGLLVVNGHPRARTRHLLTRDLGVEIESDALGFLEGGFGVTHLGCGLLVEEYARDGCVYSSVLCGWMVSLTGSL